MQWSANAALCQWLGYDIIKRLQSVDIALLMLVIKIAAERPCSGTDERARPSIRAQRAQRGTGCGTEQGRASGAAAGGGAAAGQSPGADCQRSDQSCSKQGGFNHRCCNREEADRRGDRQSRRWDAVRERHQVGHCERYPCDSACGLAGQRPRIPQATQSVKARDETATAGVPSKCTGLLTASAPCVQARHRRITCRGRRRR
jgi:hypothetical protein